MKQAVIPEQEFIVASVQPFLVLISNQSPFWILNLSALTHTLDNVLSHGTVT